MDRSHIPLMCTLLGLLTNLAYRERSEAKAGGFMLTLIALLACAVTYYVSSRWFKGINDALNRNEVDKTNGWALVIFGIANVIAMCLVFSTLLYEVSGNTESFFMMAVLLGSIVFSVFSTWILKAYQERKKR